MQLFHEMYGVYYDIVEKCLNHAFEKPVTAKELTNIIAENGFFDTEMNLMANLIDDNKYPLFEKEDNKYKARLSGPPFKLITNTQKRWIKTMLSDEKIRLFLSETEISEYQNKLENINTLFDSSMYCKINYKNGKDDYSDKAYINNFNILMTFLKEKQLIKITYKTIKGNVISDIYAPYKLEYSQQDDKFRLCGALIKAKEMKYYSKLNLSGIIDIQCTKGSYPENIDEFVESQLMPEPLIFTVKNMNNSFSRLFIKLSNYKRTAVYDEKTDTCTVTLYYYQFEEAELIIKLLSFGPILKITSPKSVVNRILEKVKRQTNI